MSQPNSNAWKPVTRQAQKPSWLTESLKASDSQERLQIPEPSHGPVRAMRGTDDELRAMKRALAHAPLGPKAVLALTGAILALESDVDAGAGA
jgi:hypothetical protein